MCFPIFHLALILILTSFSTNVHAVDVSDATVEYGVLMDYDSGEVLWKRKMDEITAPSSLTKIMTSYVIFEMLRANAFKLEDKFKVSVRAWRQDGTRMFLEPEWRISIDELLKGLLVMLGNDAAVTLAEGSSGSIGGFVEKMNNTARKLGLINTHFNNPTGLYEKTHYASVHDMAILTRSLIQNYGDYYGKYFAIESMNFNKVSQKNRNALLTEYRGTDGLTTGYTEQGNYSIAASAVRGGKRLIVVLNGVSSDRSRLEEAKKILNYGFSQYKYVKLYDENETIAEADVFLGNGDKVQLYTKNEIIYATKKSRINNLKIQLIEDKYIVAPIQKDDKLAKLRIVDGDRVIEYDIFAKNAVSDVGRLQKIKILLKYNWKKLFFFWRT